MFETSTIILINTGIKIKVLILKVYLNYNYNLTNLYIVRYTNIVLKLKNFKSKIKKD